MTPASRPRQAARSRVVRIGDVEYILDMQQKQLRAVHDPGDVMELDGEGDVEVEDDGDEEPA